MTHAQDTYTTAGQIEPGDLPEIAARGYTDVICMRPDAELAGEPGEAPVSTRIEAAAQASGLRFHYLPVTPGTLPLVQAQKLGEILSDPAARVFAYCRSGARATMLKTLSESIVATAGRPTAA